MRVLVALALVVLAPAASACSYAPPAAWSRLQWLDDGTLAAARDWDVGVYDPANASFLRVAHSFPEGEFAASPDGRFWAFVSAGSTSAGGNCSREPGTTNLLDRATNKTLVLAEGDASALAPSRERVALGIGREVRFFSWNGTPVGEAIDLREAVGNAADANASVVAEDLRFSPDASRLLVVYSATQLRGYEVLGYRAGVVAIDLRGEAAPSVLDIANVVDAAFSPDGSAVAVLSSGAPGSNVTLAREREGRFVVERTIHEQERGEALDWGRELAVSFSAIGGPEGSSTAILRRYAADLARVNETGFASSMGSGVAWSGDRLAFGEGGRVRVLPENDSWGPGAIGPPTRDATPPTGVVVTGIPAPGPLAALAALACAAFAARRRR